MAVRRIGGQIGGFNQIAATCVFYQARQLAQVSPLSATLTRSPQLYTPTLPPRTTRRRYATRRIDTARARNDMDKRHRNAFYELCRGQGALLMSVARAEQIITDFTEAQKTSSDYGAIVKDLSKKHKVDLEDISGLAIVTYKIPTSSTTPQTAQSPPPTHKPLAGLLLRGCTAAADPLATIHILNALYTASSSSSSNSTTAPGISALASLFPRSEVATYRKTLDELCTRAQTFALGPDALTLRGLYLAREGHPAQAQKCYEEALVRVRWRWNPKSHHPMALPLVAPWNALGYHLAASADPKARARAKAVFERGAREADDPASCVELAALERRGSKEWLRYRSKAAASGHRASMMELAAFYESVADANAPALREPGVKNALYWVLGWRDGAPKELGREWLRVAALGGDKGAMLRLAEWHEGVGETGKAREWLESIVDLPTGGVREDFPDVVREGRRKLAVLK